jgi:CRP/FNR family transcriptional regulator, cyclic AMP receptor protein
VTPREFFNAHPLLSGLNPDEVRDCLRQSTVKSVAGRVIVFLRGDEADGVYGILGGSVSVMVGSADGGDLILRLLKQGELFGELAVLDGWGRTASVVARSPCTLLFIPKASFVRLLAARPEVAAQVIPVLAGYLRRNTRLVTEGAFLGGATRLARQLIQLTGQLQEPQNDRSTIHISQYELACMLGVSREIVNRHLAQWRRRGLVDMSRGHIRLIDKQAILALAKESTQ